MHCGVGCQAGFGRCRGRSLKASLKKALTTKRHIWDHRLQWYSDYYDWKQGAKWYWDSDGGIFWSWDTAFNMRRKIKKIVVHEQLGGIFIWSLGQDSHDWHRLQRLEDKVKKYIN